MLVISTNPLKEPILKLLSDLKSTQWQFPYLLQTFHLIITAFLLFILLILYVTVGILSQIANSFWNVLVGTGERMSFSNPISSLFYAISVVIYFIIFLPFFLLQSPFWISGWITSKIGFRPFIILVITLILSIGIYYFRPDLPKEIIAKVISYQDSIKNEYFSSDSSNTQIEIKLESENLTK